MGIKDGFNKMDFLMCLQSEKFGNINQYKSLSPPNSVLLLTVIPLYLLNVDDFYYGHRIPRLTLWLQMTPPLSVWYLENVSI